MLPIKLIYRGKLIGISTSIVILILSSAFVVKTFQPEPMFLKIPSNFPKPTYDFANNPLTIEGFELGRKLFYDASLSRTGDISCGSCHQQYAAFIQADHDKSHGVDDQLGRRNALPIFNALFKNSFFWDGGVPKLDFVPVNPLENVVEMDMKLDSAILKLNASAKYRSLFKNAFGVDKITSVEVLHAFAQFMGAMISANSKYDKYVRKEGEMLTANELEGLKLFRTNCSSCHATDLFTDGSYRNNGISSDFTSDKGRAEVTDNPSDIGKFKVPSLRNITFTGPYMHDGTFETLEQVLEHYNSGIKHSITLDPQLIQKDGKTGIPLSKEEQANIILFLHTLSDFDLLHDNRFSEPNH